MNTIENIAEYWNRRPCNIRHSVKAVGTREYFDQVEIRKYFVEPHILDFAQFKKWNGKKVLEIGCGIGTDSINFSRSGADLTVVDISDKSLELCKKRFAIYGLTAKFYHGNCERLSSFLPIEHYDLIYSFGVIHHTPHPEEVISEIKKYCGPKTDIRIMLYSKWSWKIFWIVLRHGYGRFWRSRDLVKKYSEAQSGCPVTHYFSFRDIRKLMRGYHISEMRKDHIFPYKVDKYINYQYEMVWYFRWMPKFLFHWLEKNLGWHTLIVAQQNLSGKL